VTVALANGKTFPHPVATTTFGFDPRAEGTGTANENIVPPEWKAYYSNGSLHINNPVGPVAVYTVSGMMTGQYPKASDIAVNLSPGLYVVVSGKYAAKLPVTNSGYSGGAIVKNQGCTETFSSGDLPVARTAATTYAGEKATIYWNIISNNKIIPIDVSRIGTFKFTPEGTIQINYKNGNSTEVEYKGSSFDAEPASTTDSNIDWNLTLLHGGATYGATYDADGISYSMVTKDEFIVYNATYDFVMKVAKSSIDDMDKFNNPQKFMPVGSTIEDPVGHIGISFMGNGQEQPFVGIIYRVKLLYNDNTYGTGYYCFDLVNAASTFYPDVQFPEGCFIPAVVSEINGKVTITTSVGSHTF
jgi:hypothetical protein